jgi:hypothetical protein
MGRRIIQVMVCCLLSTHLPAQNVGIGTNTPHTSTVLDVQSANKGVSLPSMSTAQRNAILNPKTGLLVFDLDKNTIFMYDGGQWLALLFTVSETLIPPIVRTASDGAIGDQFGFCASISGNYAVIGAPFDNVGANVNQGSAYVFFRNGSVWSQQAKLVASDGAGNDLFGYSVSISGSYVIVGAYQDNTPTVDAGSAYVFLRTGTTWAEQAKLTASNAAMDDHFGFSVSINGSYAVVGAKDDDIGADVDEGSAYFFHRIGTVWTEEDNVIAPFGAAGDFFGFSVAISGDFALVGANEDDVGTSLNQGSVHVYSRNGTNWEYHAALNYPFSTDDAHFGEAVALDGNYAVIGTPFATSYAGSAAYIFIRSGTVWSQQAILVANPIVFSAPVNLFGISVAIDGDYVLIGATEVDIGANNHQGAAYLFKRDGADWLFVRKIEDSGGGPEHLMGRSAAVSGLNCVIGASGADAQKGKILFMNVE